jgi:hypothetical protein
VLLNPVLCFIEVKNIYVNRSMFVFSVFMDISFLFENASKSKD